MIIYVVSIERRIDINSCVIDINALEDITKMMEHFKQELNSKNKIEHGIYAKIIFTVESKKEKRTVDSVDEFISGDVIIFPDDINMTLCTHDCDERISVILSKHFRSYVRVDGNDEGWILLTVKKFERLLSKYKRQWFTDRKRKWLTAFVLSIPLSFVYVQLALAGFDNQIMWFVVNLFGCLGILYMFIDWVYPKVEFKIQRNASDLVKKFTFYAIPVCSIGYSMYSVIK